MPDPILLLQAFAAGVISFFAPCTVAMLPAYVGYFLGRTEDEPETADIERRPLWAAALAIPGGLALLYGLWDIFLVNSGRSGLSLLQVATVVGGTILLAVGLRFLASEAVSRGVFFGSVTSAGIVAVFVLIGFPITLLLGSILDFQTLYTFVFVVGGAIVGLGVLMLAGKDLSVAIPWKAPTKRNATSFFTFGVGYGIVATGCNLPVFLLPITAALSQGGAVDGLTAFLAYGLGTAALMVAASVAMAAGKDLTGLARRTGPWVKHAMGGLLVAAGLYVMYYAWSLITTGLPPTTFGLA